MHLASITAQNYRSLENFEINFDKNYNVIAGRNNSGKTCLFRAIRAILGSSIRSSFYLPKIEVEWDEDVTHWLKGSKPKISLSLTISFSRTDDPGAIEFISRILKLEDTSNDFLMTITRSTSPENVDTNTLYVNTKLVDDEYAKTEIMRWIRDADLLIHHDSTNYNPIQNIFSNDSNLFPLTKEEKARLDTITKQYSTTMKRITTSKKQKIEHLLGSIGERYNVELEVPRLRVDSLPFDITLSERKGEAVRLDNWGSGTRNRTLIFSSLLRASQVASDIDNISRVKPVVIIEEPEAFLHPSAQSNFGRVLEEVSHEVNVQLIASSHSPFLLSHKNSSSNYLIERITKRGIQGETKLIDTSGERWLRPYAEALGMSSDELSPWNSIIQNSSGCILVVEGDIDVRYIELFKQSVFSTCPSISVRAIGGKDKLDDKSMIKFIHKFANKVVFLVDLDATKQVSNFEQIGLKDGIDFLIAGKNSPGHRRIEGLLPEEVRLKVNSSNSELMDMLQSDQNSEKKSAQSSLKEKYYTELKSWMEAGRKAPDLERLMKAIVKAFS